MKENIGTKCKSKLIPVAKIHTAYLILTNFDIKKLLSFLNIEVAKERPWLKKSLFLCKKTNLKSVHVKKPVTRSSFLSKSVVIFVVVILKMTTLFERNEDHVTGFLK